MANNLFILGLNVSATKVQIDKQLKQIAKELSDGKSVQVTGGLNLEQSQKQIQSQLNTIAKNLKVGVQIDTTTIKQQTDAINRQLSSGINATGVKVPFKFDLSDANAVKQEINKIVDEITNNQGELVKFKINVDENGQASRVLLTYRNELNEVTNATLKLKSVGKWYDSNGTEHHIVKRSEGQKTLSQNIEATVKANQRQIASDNQVIRKKEELIAQMKLLNTQAEKAGLSLNSDNQNAFKDLSVSASTLEDIKQLESYLRLARTEYQTFNAKISKGTHASALEAMKKTLQSMPNDIALLEARFNSIKMPENVSIQIERLKADLQTINGIADSNEKIAKYNEMVSSLQNLQKQYQISSQEQKNLNADQQAMQGSSILTNRIVTWMNENREAASQYDAELKKIIIDLQNCSNKTDLTKLQQQFRVIKTQVEATNRTNGGFFSNLEMQLKNALTNMLKYQLAYKIIQVTIQSIKIMVSNSHELDDALTNISYTMDMTSSRLEKVGNSSLKMAEDLHTSASNVLSAVKLYANAKETADTILKKAQPAIMISNVTGMTGEDAAKMLQAIMNQFDMTQDDLMNIADIIEVISQNMAYDFASGINEIAAGIEQSGSVAKSAGLNLQEYASMLGLVIEKTGQGGSTVGNAYKTIFQRITKASATEGTLEEDISAAEKSLRAVGVEVRDTADNFRDLTDIMSDLGKVWNNLNSVEQSNISYNVAGVRQTNILKSLLGYWEDYENLVEKANDSSGTTLKNQEIYAKSLSGKLGKLSAIWEKIGDETLDSSVLKGFTDIGISISSLIEKVGLLKTAIAGISIITFARNFTQLKTVGESLNVLKIINNTSGIQQLSDSLKVYSTEAVKAAIAQSTLNETQIRAILSAKGLEGQELETATAEMLEAQATRRAAIEKEKATASTHKYRYALKGLGKSLKEFAIAHPLISTFAIITASVFAISKAYDALTESAEEATKRLEKNIEKTTSEYDKLTSSIEDINKRLEENTSRIEEINALDKPTYVDKQELDKLKQVNTYLDENKKLLEESQKAAAQESVTAIYDKFQTDFYTNKIKTIDDVADSSLEKNLLKVADFFTGGTITDYVITKTDEYDTDYEELTSLTKKIKELKNAQDELVQSGEDTIKVNPFTSGKWKDILWADNSYGNYYNYEQLTNEIKQYTNDIIGYKSQILTTLNEIESYDPNHDTQEAQNLLDLLNKIEASVDFDAFGKRITNQISTTSDFSEISKNISAKIKNGLLSEGTLMTDNDASQLIRKIAEEMVKAEGSVEFSPFMFAKFGESYLETYEEAVRKKVDSTDYLERAAAYIVSVFQDETSSASKNISYSPSDIFKLEDIEGKATKLGEYSEQLDKIQAAYDALTEACENYSEKGYITIDQLQALLSNGSQFLDYLIDENGNLRTDTEAMQNLTQARLIEMEAQIQQGLIDNVTGIQTEADASKYLASTNYELANSYREVASAALDAWKTNALENGLGQNTIDRVMNKYQTDSKKVHSLFEKANIGVMSDFGNAMSSKSSSKDKESSDIIDFAEYRLDKLNKLIDDTKENIDQFEGSLGKNTLIDGLIDVDKNKLNTLQSVSDLYQRMADKYFAKIPDTYKELAKNGGMNITEFIGDGNEKVIDAIENYQEWAGKVDDVNSEILELQQTLKDLQVDKFNNIKDEFDDLSGIIDTNKSQIKDVIDLLETQGKTVGSNFYEALISQTNTQIGLLQEERNRLNEQMNSALANGITIGSDEWNDMYDSLKDVDSSILSCKKDIADFQKSIDELHWDTVNDIADTFSQLNDEIGNIIDLLNVDKVSDKNGDWTDNAVTNIGLLAQQYELAKNKAETYGEQIRYLTDEYNKGLVSESDYYDKLYELQDAQWDSIKTYEEAKDAIVELNKTRVDEAIDAINEEIDAYEEMIQRQKDALSAEKALNDYKKSIAEKEKDIAALRRKINAMLGSDDASTIAEREKLEAELADKLADLEKFKYDHSIEVQQEALDKELESYKETQEERIEILEDSLNDEEKLISDSVKSAKQNANTVAKELQKVAVTYGIAISSAVIEPWKSGVGAVAYYGSALTSQTSVFQSQLNGIKSNLWNVQIQANTTADSLMNALNINSASVNGMIDMVRNNLSNAVSWANQLKNSLLSAINTDYGSGAINSIHGVTSAANVATGSLNAMIQAANAASAATNAISAGLSGIHGYVVKTGAGAQISGVFGNKQEAEAYANSHGAYVRQIFAKGGVVSAGGKIDPVARKLGEDVTVHVKEGERILTPVQNKLFEKFVNNMPNLVPVMENMNLPKLDINSLPVQRNMELKPVINIDAGITVEGSIDKSFAKDFESMQSQLTKNVTNKIANSLVKLGVQRNCCRPL